MKYFALIFGLMLTVSSWAQVGGTSDHELALYYYQSQDYEKAALYYEKLYTQKPTSYFENYFNCLLELERYKEAEKLIKKEVKKKNAPPHYFVFYGDLYNKQGLESKAEQQFESAIGALNANHGYTVATNLANAFQIRQRIDLAIKTYERAKKYTHNKVAYNIRIGELYGVQGKTELMISEFLAMLETNTGYYRQVQNALTRSIDFKEDDKKVDLLKTELIRKTQQHPNETVYNEMLIWLFEQKGEFGAAFVQVKALDKKEQMGGERIMDFGQTCENNKRYDLAIKAYKAVVDMGSNNRYYRSANYRMLNTLKTKITSTAQYTKEDLTNLEQKYLFALNEMGKAPHSINLMQDLAHLQGTFLGKSNEAVSLLEEAVTISSRTPKIQAACKMLLADVLVIRGDVWDASLYYSQVDKAFKEDVLSHEAKFKNARIFYYTGNFQLCQSQLDVLKASTQKLIANDAMELSLLITDNLALDTTATNMQLFADADLLIQQNRFKEAQQKFDSITSANKYHTLNDEILMKQYEIAIKQQDFEKGKELLTKIVADYGDDILADNALFLLGDMHENIFNDKAKAAQYYKDLIFNYQGSMFTVEARKRFRELRSYLPKEEGIKTIK